MKNKINLKNIISYIQGNIRYHIYYSNYKFLLRNHIKEQIEYRINSMNRICYDQGSCIKCGCVTTALQMANKECEGNCYPKMFSKKTWNDWKKDIITNNNWYLDLTTKKFKKYELD